MMAPESARAVRQALENHNRPPVTRGARIRAALAHIRQSINKKLTVREAGNER